MAMHKIILVIPAYNESKAIVKIINKSMEHISNIIVVDDGSTDNTAELVQPLAVTLKKNQTNKGKDRALLNGFTAAKESGATHVITMDADGQHNPDDIPRLIKAIKHHPETVIVAARLRNTQAAPRSRLIANRIADFFVSWAASQRIYDSQSGFRAYPISLLDHFAKYDNKNQHFVFESEILIEASNIKYTIMALPIDSCYPSDARKSYFSPLRDIGEITKMIATKLIKKGLNIPGLVKVLFSKNNLLEQ